MNLAIQAYKSQGVVFLGYPRFIHPSSYLDGSGRLYIGERVVISTKVTILTHDYSINVKKIAVCPKMISNNDFGIFKSVYIDDWSFIGAGAIILPGTKIGKYCIIGAGAVVKGDIPDYSIVIGNPAKIIKRTDEQPTHEINNNI